MSGSLRRGHTLDGDQDGTLWVGFVARTRGPGEGGVSAGSWLTFG